MELEDLKQTWSQYDKQLKLNLKANQELLRKWNLDKSSREMQKPLILEIANIVILIITIILCFGFSIRFLSELKFSIIGFCSVFLAILHLILGIVRVNKFLKMDYYLAPILILQKKLTELKSTILRFRKIELALIPLLVSTILPIAFKIIHNIDIFANAKLFLIEIAIILGVCYPATIWINRHWYDKKLKDVSIFLKEIENFEKED